MSMPIAVLCLREDVAERFLTVASDCVSAIGRGLDLVIATGADRVYVCQPATAEDLRTPKDYGHAVDRGARLLYFASLADATAWVEADIRERTASLARQRCDTPTEAPR